MKNLICEILRGSRRCPSLQKPSKGSPLHRESPTFYRGLRPPNFVLLLSLRFRHTGLWAHCPRPPALSTVPFHVACSLYPSEFSANTSFSPCPLPPCPPAPLPPLPAPAVPQLPGPLRVTVYPVGLLIFCLQVPLCHQNVSPLGLLSVVLTAVSSAFRTVSGTNRPSVHISE